MLSLRELQSRFFASIARSPGAGPQSFDPLLVNFVEKNKQLKAEDRINIYAEMYFARLVDVLKSDFPRVAALLGCERFHSIVSQYLAQHPSTHPSLRYLGGFFPRFLQDGADTTDLPFLSDLAALEWARVEVFDAVGAEPLRIEELQRLAPEEWPTLKFQLIPAFQVLQSDWPVQEIWHIAETEKALAILKEISPERTSLRVWRGHFSVYHTKMDDVEQIALNCLLAGQPFAALCAALENAMSVQDAALVIGSLLLRWIEDGVLAHFSSP
jgi:hypothetical protein